MAVAIRRTGTSNLHRSPRWLRTLLVLVVALSGTACGGDDAATPESLDDPTPESLDDPTPESLDAPTPESLDAPSPGSLPGSDHLHALRAADDGSLLLGLHGGLWRSEDGRDWEPLGLEGHDAMALGVAADGAPLLVGGHDVLARSTDGGETFEMLAPALPSLDIHALAQAPSDPYVVYAYVVGFGIHRSDDAGDTWTATTVGDQLPGDLAALAVDPEDPDTVLVGSAGGGVFRSTDGASTFTLTSELGTLGLAFGSSGQVLAATRRGVDQSEDGGQTWTSVASADEFAGQPLAVAIAGDGTRWMMTEGPRVLFRTDGTDFDEVARA